MKKYFLFVLAITITSSLFCALQEPYASLLVADFEPLDLRGAVKRSNIQSLIENKKPKVLVEIGSASGAMTIFIAKQLERKVSWPKLYAIDTWVDTRQSEGLVSPYHQFLSNCIHMKVAYMVVPVRMSSFEAVGALNISPDLVYIDSAQDQYQLQNDIINWYNKLKVGGILCGATWTTSDMQTIIQETASYLNLEITIDTSFWSYGPKKRL